MDFISYMKSQLDNSNIAVIENDKYWSYSEFAFHCLQVYVYLRIHHVKKVMVCLPQGFYAYTIIWGAYCAGVTFCPVATSVPLERRKYYLTQFSPDLIVTDTFESNNDNRSIPVSVLFKKQFIIEEICPRFDNQLLAYVIFTSGSSGLPKGVMIKRNSLENFLNWSTDEYDVMPGDRWGQFSNLGFDLSICDIFTAVLKGATLVPISTQAEKLMPGRVIKSKKITFWHSVPSVIDIINKAEHLKYDYLGSLKTMVFCGERLFPSQLELLFGINPSLTIYNTYGPTEATIICSFIKLTIDNYKQYCHNTVCIGHALPGYEISLSEKKDNKNEIIIKSDYLAAGYLNNNDSINAPFKIITKKGVQTFTYNTGDFGELFENNLYFVSRKDSQIKIMGHRIDLSEIDYHLRMYGCKSNITAFYKDKIIAFVIHDTFNRDEIMNYLKKYLPSYYLPHIIISKQNFPYNINGKIDLKELLNNVEI